MQVNPVLKRELKQSARTRKMIVLVTGFNLLQAIFGLFAFYLSLGAKGGDTKFQYSSILTIYAIITGIEYCLAIIIVPALTTGAVSGEREKQTLDILLASGITTGSIVRGKLLSGMSMMILLSVSSLPVLGVVFAIGGITVADITHFLVLIITTSVFIGSIGMLFSCVCKRTSIATVCTYTTLLILILGTTTLLLGENFFGSLIGVQGTTYIYSADASIEVNASIGILLLNPAFSFFSMLKDQIGFSIASFGRWKTSSQQVYYVLQHWYVISIAVQLTVSAILIQVSAVILRKNTHK